MKANVPKVVAVMARRRGRNGVGWGGDGDGDGDVSSQYLLEMAMVMVMVASTLHLCVFCLGNAMEVCGPALMSNTYPLSVLSYFLVTQ